MKKSPVNEIQYNESKSILIIKATSKDMLEKLSKELQRAAYEAVRDRGVSQNITVNTVDDSIHVSGHLNIALAHLSCQEYVDLDTTTKLRTEIMWAKCGTHTLISPPRPLPKAAETGGDPVIIHTLKSTLKPGSDINKTPPTEKRDNNLKVPS